VLNASTALGARAPDLVEPVIGYRQWRLHDGTLCSPFVDYPWRRGVNTARCELSRNHPDPAPGHDCVCGIHAWYRPCPRLGYATPELVAGAVVLWGDVELHPTGMRSEHATIVALVLPLAHTSKRRRVVELADGLEVEAVPARQLTATALDHGKLLASDLTPRAA
jgi:hypothetical protein